MSKLIFKNIIAFIIFFTLTSVRVNSQDRVGINNDNPQAALDIKSDNDDNDKVLRVPADLADSNSNESVFFVGKISQGQNGETVHDLRKMTPEEFGNRISSYIPSLSNITVTNDKRQAFTGGNDNIKLNLDKEVINTNSNMFFFGKNESAIEILQEGEYNITVFVGFEEIKNHSERRKTDEAEKNHGEGDIIISIAIKKWKNGHYEQEGGVDNYINYKRNVISRTRGKVYRVADITGAGIGGSFSFTNHFNAKDRVRIHVNKVFYGKEKDLVLKKNGSSFTIMRVSPTINLN